MTKVSAIIVSYNVKKLLRQCLDSLRRSKLDSGFELEVWVVDNNSKDGTSDMVAKEFSWVNFIPNGRNLGFAVANNQAIRKIKDEFIFLLNPDATTQKNTIETMLAYMNKHNEVGILGPMLLNSDGIIQKEMSPFPRLLDSLLILLKLHRIKPLNYLVYPNYDYNKMQEAEHLMGSALFIRRKVFEDIGLFDEDFFLWFEETDLEKRTKDAGWKIVYYPKAKVTHLVGQSSRQVNPFKKQAIWNNSLLTYSRKHFSFLARISLFPFLLISYLAVIAVYFKNKSGLG